MWIPPSLRRLVNFANFEIQNFLTIQEKSFFCEKIGDFMALLDAPHWAGSFVRGACTIKLFTVVIYKFS